MTKLIRACFGLLLGTTFVLGGGQALALPSTIQPPSTGGSANIPATTVPLCGSGTAGTAQACGSYISSVAGLSGTPSAAQIAAALPAFTSTTAGLTPASGGGTANFLRADGSWAAPPGGSGGLTSVGLSVPSILSVAGSPLTSNGTLAVSLASQAANLVLAAPNGASGTPAFRALTASDIPALSYDASGAAAAATATALQKLANLSDLASAATARANLGLGTAATQSTTAFDATGAAASAVVGALPSATTSQLYGGTGAAGTAAPITLGTGLTLTGGTLTASGSSGPANPLNFRGAWAASTAYAVNDVVIQGGALYVAPTAFTSTSTFSVANWTPLAYGAPAASTITYASTITPDFTSVPTQTVTLTGNLTLACPTVPTGTSVQLWLVQDGTGSRTWTPPAVGGCIKWLNGAVPPLPTAANSAALLSLISNGTYIAGVLSGPFQ